MFWAFELAVGMLGWWLLCWLGVLSWLVLFFGVGWCYWFGFFWFLCFVGLVRS